MTKEEFIDKIKTDTEEAMFEHSYLRYGPTILNTVAVRYPEAARKALFDYGIDCFYDDNKVDEFLDICYKIIFE